MVKAKKVLFASMFQGAPSENNFRVEEEELSEDVLKEREILIETLFLSLDPYVRLFARILPAEDLIDKPVMGEVVAKVTHSKSPLYNVGDVVLAKPGWVSHAVVDDMNKDVRPYPLIGSDFSASLALGVLGLPGATAYFGVHDILAPKKGETFLINAAAGAVGSVAGQMAKLKGCRVIGFAGSDEKVKFLKDELGFDHAFNYKTADVNASIAEAAPDGVDCFFDNVGGDFAAGVWRRMRDRGRVCCVGSISGYNSLVPHKVEDPCGDIVFKELRIQGLMCLNVPFKRWYDEAFKDIAAWVKDDKIKFKENITKGLENAPAAFLEMMLGVGVGKSIVSMT